MSLSNILVVQEIDTRSTSTTSFVCWPSAHDHIFQRPRRALGGRRPAPAPLPFSSRTTHPRAHARTSPLSPSPNRSPPPPTSSRNERAPSLQLRAVKRLHFKCDPSSWLATAMTAPDRPGALAKCALTAAASARRRHAPMSRGAGQDSPEPAGRHRESPRHAMHAPSLPKLRFSSGEPASRRFSSPSS